MVDARAAGRSRVHFQENTMVLDADRLTDGGAVNVLNAAIRIVGHGNLLVLRPRRAKEYEVTLADKKSTDVLMDGVEVNGVFCAVQSLRNKDMVVSFLHLPAYILDDDILGKLRGWGVVPLQPIRRRYYPGTDVTDGTRYVKVRFPKSGLTLPYSTSFVTAEGPRYFRVIHDRQVKTCRLCMDPGHLMRDCLRLICRDYCEQGHFARECTAVKCPQCKRALISCVCQGDSMEERPDDEPMEHRSS